MSNLIKYQFVNLDGKESVVINNNKDTGNFVPLKKKSIKIQTVGEIEAEKAIQRVQDLESDMPQSESDENGEFKAGLQVTNFDKLFHEQEKKSKKKAESIIVEAQAQAESILSEAQDAVEAERAKAYDEGKEQGYQEGLAQAQESIQIKENELMESQRAQKQELEDYVTSLESKYVDIVISLVCKLTGVLIEDKQDLVLYLIKTAAADLDTSENYRIRVCSEDVFYLEGHKEELIEELGGNVSLDIVEEKGLEKDQCIIETDTQMIDCGFQTQLDMLVQNLKMLVH